MGKFARIQSLINGILMILISIVTVMDPLNGYTFVFLIITFMLFTRGVRLLYLYITAAIHMVDGKAILFRSIIALDCSFFFYMLQEVPPRYLIIFLMAINLFMALVELLRAREAQKLGASSWRLYLAEGIVSVAIAFICQFTHDSVRAIVLVFGLGLLLSGCMRIAAAFRKTEILFIQ